MNEERLPRIMVTCSARIPSVELAAIIPLSELQKQGLCVFIYKDTVNLSLKDIAWCDILIILRGAGSQTVWAAQQAKHLGRVVLGYWDDDLLDIPKHSLSYPHYSTLQVKKSINQLFELTDCFFSPSTKLAAKLSLIHGRIANVLPGVLGSQELSPPKPRDNKPPIIGFAGSVDHTDYLDRFLGPALKDVADVAAVKLHIVGAKPHFIGNLPIETTYTQYIQNYQDYLDFASKLNWDIGLAPQVDCEFTSHKFYNKLLEYTYIGCAGIYSKLEPYTNVIQDGITGLLVDNQVEAWKDAILRLLADPGLRFKIASNAFEFVQKNHNREVIAEKYSTTLAPFLSHRAPKVGKSYVITHTMAFMVSSMWALGAEYVRAHGIRQFFVAAIRYLFRFIRAKLSRHYRF